MIFLKELRYIFIVIIMMLVLAVVAIIAVLKDEDGRNWLVSKVAKYVANEVGYTIQIKQIDTSQADNWKITDINARNNRGQEISMDYLTIKWDLPLLFDGKIRASNINITNLNIHDNIHGNVSSFFQVNNSWSGFFIDTSAEFVGKANEIPLTVNIAGRGQTDDFILDFLKIKTSGVGKLELNGGYNKKALDFNLKANTLPSQVIAAGGWNLRAGKFNANIEIKGTSNLPVINGSVNFTSSISKNNESIPIIFNGTVKTIKDQLNLNVGFKNNKDDLGYTKFSLPLTNYLESDSNFSSVPLKGNVTTDFDVEYIQALFEPEIHDVKGVLKVNVNLAGTIGKPAIEGDLSMKNGSYKNTQTGTVLKNINVQIKASKTELNIISASAEDNGEGKLELSGSAKWSDIDSGNVNFMLNSDKAKILRRNDIEGVLTGELGLTGSFKELLLKGKLKVTPFTLTLDNLISQDIAEIKVTEEYSENGENNEPVSSKFVPVINLDISLLAENQAYLRGAGLSAELEGAVKINGTVKKPEYSGKFQTVRGNYEILGKKFNLKEGNARFEGDTISLFITGVHANKTTQIIAELSGTLEDLNLKLSSIPNMPQGEIVSNLLFGKASKDITPLQAIKLANAIRKLKSGGKELFNPIETARKLIGADNISVDSEQTENGQEVTVGVGKYINERVYIEVEKGSNPSQTVKGSVEVEISPNLSVKSSTGGGSNLGGVEVQWKHDY